jgi:lipooligosaccharide transport system ATP-binding protein
VRDKATSITNRLPRQGLYLTAWFPWCMSDVVVAEKLTKDYEEFRAVDGIDFSIHLGECFGFLGPNGAGKSTTMRMIHCASPLTSGKLKVLDLDVEMEPRRIKSLIGVAPQENNLDPDFSVIKNLTVYARYFDMDKSLALKRAEELLKFMQLTEKRDEMVTDLSGGMKRRLIIARALINEPRILILDEPTTGLDPQARHLIWERIRELKRKGVTVILTTHYMDEAEKLCDRLVIMDKGKIVVEGTPRKLIEERIGAEVVEIDEPSHEVEAFAKERGLDFERTADRLLIYSRCCEDLLSELRSKFQLDSVIIRRATLEDVFLRLTGRRLVE